MIRLIRFSREKLKKLYHSRYEKFMQVDFEKGIIEIVYYFSRANYKDILLFLNHENLHLILDRRIGRDASLSLDNIEKHG